MPSSIANLDLELSIWAFKITQEGGLKYSVYYSIVVSQRDVCLFTHPQPESLLSFFPRVFRVLVRLQMTWNGLRHVYTFDLPFGGVQAFSWLERLELDLKPGAHGTADFKSGMAGKH